MFMKTSAKIKSYLTLVCSNYSKYSKYYNNANNLVVGKMKGETCCVLIKRFVGLKSKMYTFITEDNHESEISKALVKMMLTMN